MSLLNRGTNVVTVFADESRTDGDGNKLRKPSAVGIVCRAVVQPLATTEDQDGAVPYTEERLRLRLVGWQGVPLGSKSEVEWQGRRYTIYGEPRQFRGSRRTSHVDYTLIRR